MPSQNEQQPDGMLSMAEVREFSRHLAAVAGAAVPLPAGCRALADELPTGKLKRLFQAMAARFEAGDPVDAVIARYQKRFPEHLRGLILAGLRAGELSEVLEQYVDHSQRAADLRREIGLSVIYPLLLLFVVLGFGLFSTNQVVPRFAATYEDFEIDLPTFTAFLIGLSTFVASFVLPITVLLALVIAALYVAGRTRLGQRLRRRIPLFGPLYRWGALAQFTGLLALLTRRRVPMPLALRLAGAAADDPALCHAALGAADAVENGQPFAKAARDSGLFARPSNTLLEWAEKNNVLPDCLEAVAEMLIERTRSQGAMVRTAVPASLFLVVMVSVALAMTALITSLSLLLTELGKGA